MGRPKIGGEFELLMPTPVRPGDEAAAQQQKVEARRVTDEDLKGSFSLVYFGFTNCECLRKIV